ncbi:D-2-hydroxyacid dehydrogenase [Salibacteraceae bacterium]|jgi:D-3-phosphoglycerate dehydrogenase / 2-oxoglutarate reductase|nr:D-2-hydroxyacid dehydrogenase [Salibacteraceae bacterium]MDA9267262.1 D-2-hydroxyacid dehydrogenase [Salibacteraceae bacterium]MDB9708784.1 D-2-hydroxyacid dehydrogenase [Salibacteraceae bacterium]HAQ71379.1 3-phosphoglycerate dehydrogenase [Flavobacteriales bacterium]
MRILANDGISPSGKAKLEANGFEVVTETIPQENLTSGINEGGFVGILVRSATQVRKEHMDACPSLKLIGRGGVGMDNIDVQYGRDKGLHVINTPAASSQSVAELAVASLFSMARFTYDANRKMPATGKEEFKVLKKSYSKGTELRGKTLGVIGFGGIGQTLAKYAIGLGMNVKYVTKGERPSTILELDIAGQSVKVTVERTSMEDLLATSDYISLHVPKQADGSAVIGQTQIEMMKPGVGLINTSRGGSIDEDALIAALDSGHVKAAALDVFVGEPAPREDVLSHAKIISTPHIGGSTVEAQDRIGVELADQIIALLK